MGMFDRYDKLNIDYIPNNSINTNYSHVKLDNILPKCVYDINEHFIGYSWNRGEHFLFNLYADDVIKVAEDSIVYNKCGESPTEHTPANRIGQQAYNTADRKSWTFVGESADFYVWQEDKEFIYTVGDTPLEIPTDMTNKKLMFFLYDFRWEPVYQLQSDENSHTLTINIDDSFDKQVPSGVYYGVLKIMGNESSQIKNKFTIIIN